MPDPLLLVMLAFVVGCVVGFSLRSPAGDGGRSRRVERKLDLLLAGLGVKDLPGLSPEVQELARDPRQKIAAIRLHREQTGCGLAEAKQDVEDFIQSKA